MSRRWRQHLRRGLASGVKTARARPARKIIVCRTRIDEEPCVEGGMPCAWARRGDNAAHARAIRDMTDGVAPAGGGGADIKWQASIASNWQSKRYFC